MGFTLREQIIIGYFSEHQNAIYQRNEMIKANKDKIEEFVSTSKEFKRLSSQFSSFCTKAIEALGFDDYQVIESICEEYKLRRHPELALKLELLKRQGHQDILDENNN